MRARTVLVTYTAVLAAMAHTSPVEGEGLPMDTIATSKGNLEITFIGHGTLMFALGTTVVHIDPWTQLADYTKLPKADLVLVTHEHRDHLDAEAIRSISKDNTKVVVNRAAGEPVPGCVVMKNGDTRTVAGVAIEAVPAYNVVHMRSQGVPYHPRGDGNGYVLTFGDTRVYVAGDTENISEMRELRNIRVAFLPMNLPYTMTPEMAAEAAKAFRPSILYPYHYGDTDTSTIGRLLAGTDIEVRIRPMK